MSCCYKEARERRFPDRKEKPNKKENENKLFLHHSASTMGFGLELKMTFCFKMPTTQYVYFLFLGLFWSTANGLANFLVSPSRKVRFASGVKSPSFVITVFRRREAKTRA